MQTYANHRPRIIGGLTVVFGATDVTVEVELLDGFIVVREDDEELRVVVARVDVVFTDVTVELLGFEVERRDEEDEEDEEDVKVVFARAPRPLAVDVVVLAGVIVELLGFDVEREDEEEVKVGSLVVKVEFAVTIGGITTEVRDDKIELIIVEIGLGATVDEVMTAEVVVGALVELVKRLVVLAAKACCPNKRAARSEKFVRDFMFASIEALKYGMSSLNEESGSNPRGLGCLFIILRVMV